MRGRNTAVHLCSFATGWFDVTSRSGRQGLVFEDSDRFGPAKVNLKTGDLTPIPDKHWFWRFHHPWLMAGRPVTGAVKPNCGWGFDVQVCRWPDDPAGEALSGAQRSELSTSAPDEPLNPPPHPAKEGK